ncbi:MAG: iron-sulfur cluster assembly accessory protein [Methanomassiliicoccales archaeon]
MVYITEEANKFINDLIEKNDKKGYGIIIYIAGIGCSGPQFGMAFQEKKEEGDVEDKQEGFSFYYDEETQELLEGCKIDYIETPQGSGLIIHNPNINGCDSCGGGCH